MKDDPSSSKRADLFARLRVSHDTLQALNSEHDKTGYGCKRSGQCCQVGLELPLMECEHIAEVLKASRTPKELKAVVARLERAFTDESWTWAESIGEHMCAFYDMGCSIHAERPAVCRMYGVVLDVDSYCPRERLANGKDYIYVQKNVDGVIADYYRALDEYGRLFPKLDYTVYMPAGVLQFLAPERIPKLRAKTATKFWKREKGYRTQFKASYRRGEGMQTNVTFPFKIPQVRAG